MVCCGSYDTDYHTVILLLHVNWSQSLGLGLIPALDISHTEIIQSIAARISPAPNSLCAVRGMSLEWPAATNLSYSCMERRSLSRLHSVSINTFPATASAFHECVHTAQKLHGIWFQNSNLAVRDSVNLDLRRCSMSSAAVLSSPEARASNSFKRGDEQSLMLVKNILNLPDAISVALLPFHAQVEQPMLLKRSLCFVCQELFFVQMYSWH
jgi:hypothetical protein